MQSHCTKYHSLNVHSERIILCICIFTNFFTSRRKHQFITSYCSISLAVKALHTLRMWLCKRNELELGVWRHSWSSFVILRNNVEPSFLYRSPVQMLVDPTPVQLLEQSVCIALKIKVAELIMLTNKSNQIFSLLALYSIFMSWYFGTTSSYY